MGLHALNVSSVIALAVSYGYTQVQHNVASRVLGFKKLDDRVNVYYTTGTVGTCVEHPKSGRTQLFRRHQTFTDLKLIFANPRVHTGNGYYRKQSSERPEPSRVHDGTNIWARVTPHEHQRWILEADMHRTVQIALGDETYFMLMEDGSTRWGRNLPTQLYNKLNGRQKSLPPPDFVALDSSNNAHYYVSFADGRSQWVGPDSLSSALYESNDAVELVVFAPNDGWYVLWSDGSFAWDGLPRGLHNQLNGRQKSLPGVEDLSCGPQGEWFVRFTDGSWRCNGLPRDLSDTMADVRRAGGDIISIAFGSDWSWVLTYAE